MNGQAELHTGDVHEGYTITTDVSLRKKFLIPVLDQECRPWSWNPVAVSHGSEQQWVRCQARSVLSKGCGRLHVPQSSVRGIVLHKNLSSISTRKISRTVDCINLLFNTVR